MTEYEFHIRLGFELYDITDQALFWNIKTVSHYEIDRNQNRLVAHSNYHYVTVVLSNVRIT